MIVGNFDVNFLLSLSLSFKSDIGVEKIPVRLNESSKLNLLLLIFFENEKLLFNPYELEILDIPELKLIKLKLLACEE